jgi:hypothetical protein
MCQSGRGCQRVHIVWELVRGSVCMLIIRCCHARKPCVSRGNDIVGGERFHCVMIYASGIGVVRDELCDVRE